MGPSDAVNILIIIILLILSAYFSSAETALTTVNKIRMRSLAEENNKAAKRVLKLIEEPSKMLSAVLICNNIVNHRCKKGKQKMLAFLHFFKLLQSPSIDFAS